MRSDVLSRLKALEDAGRDEGAFLLADGTRWICPDPLGWAMLNAGKPAPNGVAVVGYEPPEGPCDGLSESIYELIKTLIKERNNERERGI